MSIYGTYDLMGLRNEEYWSEDWRRLTLEDGLAVLEEIVRSTPEDWFHPDPAEDPPVSLSTLYDRAR